ncbi:MAG: hypothetical protein Q9184_006190 [Pyrenodesmia sp. 2 TL-2023]
MQTIKPARPISITRCGHQLTFRSANFTYKFDNHKLPHTSSHSLSFIYLDKLHQRTWKDLDPLIALFRLVKARMAADDDGAGKEWEENVRRVFGKACSWIEELIALYRFLRQAHEGDLMGIEGWGWGRRDGG